MFGIIEFWKEVYELLLGLPEWAPHDSSMDLGASEMPQPGPLLVFYAFDFMGIPIMLG